MKEQFCFVWVIIFVLLYITSRGEAQEYKEEMREYGFKFSALAPMGFWLYDKFPYSFKTSYDRRVRGKVAHLFGQQAAQIYFEVHNIQKLSYVLLSIFVLGFIVAEDPAFWWIALVGLVGVYLLQDKELDKRLKAKKEAILIDLPQFLNTIALLINAGLTFNSSVDKVVKEHDPERPLFKELNVTLAEILAGKPVNEAYEEMAQRCKVPEVTRFISTVLQNINKGSSDLARVIQLMAHEAWQRRKDIAKKHGEEASSKLVFPMVLIFLAVTIIVLAPAIISMNQ